MDRGSARNGSLPHVRRAGSKRAGVALAIALGLGALSGTGQPAVHAQTRRLVTIGASGDLLLQPRVVSAGRAAIDGFDRVLSPIRVMAPDDVVAFANLEAPLSEELPVFSGSPPTLGAPADVAGSIARAGIDVVSLANNHAWDQGARGAALTQQALVQAGVRTIGAGATADEALAPAIFERHGVRVAFVGVTQRVNAGPGHAEPRAMIATWDEARIESALARARDEADVVVVSIHWSHDFRPEPRTEERELARFLVAHGADVILAHGPHVLHPIERLPSPRGDALCAYSLGNLVSNQGFAYRTGHAGAGHEATWRPDTRDGAWLRVRLRVGEGHVAIDGLEAVPLFTYNNYFAREADEEPVEDIRVQRLADVDDAALAAERRDAIARALGREVELVER